MRTMYHLRGAFHFGWVIFAIPLVLFFAVAYSRFLFGLPLKTRLLFLLAGILYVGGALGVEFVGGWYHELHGSEHLGYSMITTGEETLELVGVIVFIYALLEYMSSYLREIEIHIDNN